MCQSFQTSISLPFQTLVLIFPTVAFLPVEKENKFSPQTPEAYTDTTHLFHNEPLVWQFKIIYIDWRCQF